MSEDEELLYEPHAIDSIDISNGEQKWKPFKIEPCYVCGKIPIIKKDFDFQDNRRYTLHCCIGTVGGYSETLCITRWNDRNDTWRIEYEDISKNG